MDPIAVRDALTLNGIIYGPGMEIPPEVWLRLPERERNALLNLGKVERGRARTPLPGAGPGAHKVII